jgi:CTP synthase (UTP-ammonia lyase)
MIRILLVGDFSDSVIAHGFIPRALALASAKAGAEVSYRWLPTEQITSGDSLLAANANGIWCVPGSPYRNMEGVLSAIRHAREKKIPFLGTCGGFQHALIEYARNALNISDADHLETNPEARTPLISKLSCALVNKSETIRIYPQTKLARIYDSLKATEPYQCSYGLNGGYKDRFQTGPLKFTAFNDELEVRGFELEEHPFFIGALFQPERSATTGRAHPIITAFVNAASQTVD